MSDAKKTEIKFFVKVNPTTMIKPEKIQNSGYSWDLTRRPRFSAKKFKITFLRENWPDDHDLARR
jgi:hypothetical protein